MRTSLLLLCLGWPCLAQSIAITSPSPGQVLSGYSGFSFSASLTSAPSTSLVCYEVDSFHVVETDNGALPLTGCATPATNFSLAWDTFMAWNGSHSVVATAYDTLGNVVATSPAVAFTVSNSWPVACAPGMTVNTSTALNVNWSGTVTVTPTISGTCSGDNKFFNLFVDGILVQSSGSTAGTNFAFPLDTTPFPNSSHIITVNADDTSGGTSYTGSRSGFASGYAGQMTEWSATVTFANAAATPMEVRTDAYEMFLATNATHQLTTTLYNSDGTTTATTPQYYSQNANVATVSSTGLVTAVSSAPASTQIRVMAPVISGTDLHCFNNNCTTQQFFTSASHPFNPQDAGTVICITAANGWTPGCYEINFANTAGTIALTSVVNGVSTVNVKPGSGSTGGGTFTTGPSRTAWALVSASTVIPHFGNDSSILTTYTAGKSMWLASTFQSSNSLPASIGLNTDQPYSPGFAADEVALGFAALETGLPAYPGYSQTQANWQSATNTTLQKYQSALAGTNLKWVYTGDSWQAGQALFDVTRGPSAYWTPPAYTDLMNRITTYAPGIALEEQDEVQNPYGCCPNQVIPTFGNGLTSIVASSGTCTVNGTVQLNLSHFLISGATTAGFNSAAGSVYLAITKTPNITFSCSVANGTYNASTDPNLTLEPYAQNWFNNTTGSATVNVNDYIRWNAFQTIRGWINAANAGHPQAEAPSSGNGYCQAVQNWSSNLGSPSGLGDYASLYYSTFVYPFTASRNAIYTLESKVGAQYRGFWGCFNPAQPVLHEIQGTSTDYGFQGIKLTVASFSGNTITFSTPHGVPNVIPGITKVSLTGMSNSADNGVYIVLSTPTATTMTVADLGEDITATDSGTITFSPSGATKTGVTINLSPGHLCGDMGGSTPGCSPGNRISYSGAIDPNFPRHRGETFTCSGCTSADAGRTFIYAPENLPSVTTQHYLYRLLPQGSSTSGNAEVLPDMNMVLGRNATMQVVSDPDFVFIDTMYAMVLRGAGYRMYASYGNTQGYNPGGGYVGSQFGGWITNFPDTANYSVQLWQHPHWENFYSRPASHAAGMANLLVERVAPYALTASLSSPDYGPAFECSARTGAMGNMLVCLNMTDAPQTRTFSLTPYLASGQSIIRFTGSWSAITLATLSSGTSSDTVTARAGQAIIWLFPLSFAGELQQPVISARLEDVPNATRIAVCYGYDSYLMDGCTSVFDLEDGTRVLPVDRKIGPVYYRLVYLDVVGNVVASSDIQTL